ncbi:MAG: hypothetical protein RR385_06945 [Clostridiales bacterium]
MEAKQLEMVKIDDLGSRIIGIAAEVFTLRNGINQQGFDVGKSR